MKNSKKIKALREYFIAEQSVLIAFLFGSRSKDYSKESSDWDIAVYFKPKNRQLELEENIYYPEEERISRDLERILDSEVDLVVINRAFPSLVFEVLNKGLVLVVKDRKVFLNLLIASSREATDYYNFAFDYWEIQKRSSSLSHEDKLRVLEMTSFLERELSDYEYFEGMTPKEYEEDSIKRRAIERWIENLINSSLDIAKILMASEKMAIPHSYRETLFRFGIRFFDEAFAEKFSEFSKLRNILAHEYLDIRWERISFFLKEAKPYFKRFLEKLKEFLE